MALKRVSNSSRSSTAAAASSGGTPSNPSSSPASLLPLNLSAEHELVLIESLLANKLAGRHKHFRMAVVMDTLNRALSAADLVPAANAGHIWQFLDTLYDMEKVEEIEVEAEGESKTSPSPRQEFRLPRKEFGAIIEEMRRNGKIGKEAAAADGEGEGDEEEEDESDAEEEEEDEGEGSEAAMEEAASTPKSGSKRPTRSTPSMRGRGGTPARRKRAN